MNYEVRSAQSLLRFEGNLVVFELSHRAVVGAVEFGCFCAVVILNRNP